VAATQSSTYPSSQAGSYAAVPGASPYGATQTVMTPAGAYAAPSGEQQYAQPAFGQPGIALQSIFLSFSLRVLVSGLVMYWLGRWLSVTSLTPGMCIAG